jgi:hypothetical protein
VTVIERLYDNDWYVAHAAPAAREGLAADLTSAWMERESAVEHAELARSVAGVDPVRCALAMSTSSAAQAALDRARSRQAEAQRCTDIIGGHAFSTSRTSGPNGSMTVEVSSCTLVRRAVLRLARPRERWSVELVDPQSRSGKRIHTVLTADPWEALHCACDWITTGSL